MSPDYAALARTLTESLGLPPALPPIAVCLADAVPAGVADRGAAPRVPAGCVFWQQAATGVFATGPADHAACAIGTFTHNLDPETGAQDRADALKVFADLGYLPPAEVPGIPVLRRPPRHVVYAPLAQTPLPPDVVLLFVKASQTLILSEATASVDGGAPPALGRPACAIVPQAVESGRAALSLGCCGARAYLDLLTDDVALFALPGGKLPAYAARIAGLARANQVLGRFHQIRRRDIEAGRMPSIKESLAALERAS